MRNDRRAPDGRPTMADWPIRVETLEELPAAFRARACAETGGDLAEWSLVYAPQRPAAGSFAYLFGYGRERVFYLRGESDGAADDVSFARDDVFQVDCSHELLAAALTVSWRACGQPRQLTLDYVPSVYYLYDPFLNWLLHLPRDFVPALAEKAAPRPQALFAESLTMYNYLLDGYRLGAPAGRYEYRCVPHRRKWMPWKIVPEETLSLRMAHGEFSLYNYSYLSRRSYRPDQESPAERRTAWSTPE